VPEIRERDPNDDDAIYNHNIYWYLWYPDQDNLYLTLRNSNLYVL
jgi:hypothetical protein